MWHVHMQTLSPTMPVFNMICTHQQQEIQIKVYFNLIKYFPKGKSSHWFLGVSVSALDNSLEIQESWVWGMTALSYWQLSLGLRVLNLENIHMNSSVFSDLNVCLGLKSIQLKNNLNLKRQTSLPYRWKWENFQGCMITGRMQGHKQPSSITITGQQQVTDFLSEFSPLFLSHHLLILT